MCITFDQLLDQIEDPKLRAAMRAAVMGRIAYYRKPGQKDRYTPEEFFNAAWLYVFDPIRQGSLQHELENTYNPNNTKSDAGEYRLRKRLEMAINAFVVEDQRSTPSRVTIKQSELSDLLSGRDVNPDAVEIHRDSRRIYWDGGDPDCEPGSPYARAQMAEMLGGDTDSDDAPVYGNGFFAIDTKADRDWSDRAKFPKLNGRYGVKQERPFGILAHARLDGVISEYQVELLRWLMGDPYEKGNPGDAMSDLRCRYPDWDYDRIRQNVSRALRKLRQDPQVQEWARSLGYDVLSTSGPAWESEHRHEDGRPEGPISSWPLECTCDRGQTQPELPDRADPIGWAVQIAA